jgi:hypothetical protein
VRVPEDAVGYDYLSSLPDRTELEKEDYKAFITLCSIAKAASIVSHPAQPPHITLPSTLYPF